MTERPSFYQTLRRRIAPVAFLLALAVLAARTCQSDIAEVEIVMDLGPRAGQVEKLRVDVFREGENTSVLVLDKNYDAAGATSSPRMRAQLDRGTYHMEFSVLLHDGPRRFERILLVDASSATIHLDLARHLTRAD